MQEMERQTTDPIQAKEAMQSDAFPGTNESDRVDPFAVDYDKVDTFAMEHSVASQEETPSTLRTWGRVLIPIVMLLVLSMVVTAVFLVLYAVGVIGEQVDYQQFALSMGVAISIISEIILFPIFVFMLRRDRNKIALKERFSLRDRARIHPEWGWAILASVMYGIAGNIILPLTPIMENDEAFQMTGATFDAAPLWLVTLFVLFIAPIFEELLFRGLVFGRLRMRYRPATSIVLSAVLFGLFHMNVTQGIFASILGFFLAWVYHRSNTLFLPILCHIMSNLCATLFVSLSFYESMMASSAKWAVVAACIVLIVTGVVQSYQTIRKKRA